MELKDIKKGAAVRITQGPYAGSHGTVVRHDRDVVLIQFPDRQNKPDRVKALPSWLEPDPTSPDTLGSKES